MTDLGLGDYRINQALAWTHLVEIKCHFMVHSAIWGESDLDDPKLKRIISKLPSKIATLGNTDRIGLTGGNGRLEDLLLVFRYVDLGPDWVQLFDLLLAIDAVLNQLWSLHTERMSGFESLFRSPHERILTEFKHVGYQWRSLVNLAAFIGLHQFIDLFLQHCRYPNEAFDNRRDLVMYGIARSTIAAFNYIAPDHVFATKTLEALFNHEPVKMVKIVFPPESPVAGIPLWHAFLLHAWPFNTRASTKALELWLRNGANPHVAFMSDCYRRNIREVYDRRDGSGHLKRDDIADIDYFMMPRDFKLPAGSLTLRRWVEMSELANKQTLLQLIGEDLVDDVAEGPAAKLQHAE